MDNYENMKLRLDYNNMMSEFVGDEGFTARQLADCDDLCACAFDTVQANRGKGMMEWSELPYNQAEVVADINATAENVRKNFKYFVVLGIGGSALGPIAVFNALKHLHYNDLPDEKRNGPKFYVEDNVDPERMAALFDVIELDKTCFNVITKSGSTSETMSQYLIVWDALKKAFGDKAKDHMIATTSKNSGNLIKLAKKEGLKTFYIPDGVGGRFSELCPVGLLPAAVLGIDIAMMLKGAEYMDKTCCESSIKTNPAMAFAVLQYLAYKNGKNVSVMMPYADSLRYMADWYCQLWAESLGKEVKKSGAKANVGQTPVKSLGVTDQHSQVQLYTEGPFDKVVTFVAVDEYRTTVTIPYGCEEFPNVNFLCGHTMNELITTEMNATAYALNQKKRLNNTVYLPKVNEFTLGQFMFMLELATAYIGEMFGIDTYNQPGVEGGKNATYAMFKRAGFEEKRKEMEAAPSKKKEYII
ncbi:MAG: glucose-6-phosphate isomerase [Clostridia bacterium]|nr:glucose-6-phosphate isomerase [Clostridia bacterium]